MRDVSTAICTPTYDPRPAREWLRIAAAVTAWRSRILHPAEIGEGTAVAGGIHARERGGDSRWGEESVAGE